MTTIAPDAYSEFKTTGNNETAKPAFSLTPQIPNNTDLLIIINTSPTRSKRRHTLRETWAKQASFPIAANSTPFKSNSMINIAYFFMMAFHGDSSIDKDIERESNVHRDILRVNLSESYRGMVNKILLTFEWVTSLDIKPDFIAKADDDVYVKMPDLARWLQENAHLSANLYTGFVQIPPHAVVRRHGHRWFVSREEYEDDYYPPYCLGPFYIFSRDVFLSVVLVSRVTRKFPVEDAFVGVLVRKIGLQPLLTGTHLFNGKPGLVKRALKYSGDDMEVPPGIVLGDSLSPEDIKMIHNAYTKN